MLLIKFPFYISGLLTTTNVTLIFSRLKDSDGCTYQNRNITLSNTLLKAAHDRNITIFQKYLEKGHTQMEVDSVHSVIERKLKNKPIYVPVNYIDIFEGARTE
jgi:hypothetical protein